MLFARVKRKDFQSISLLFIGNPLIYYKNSQFSLTIVLSVSKVSTVIDAYDGQINSECGS